MKKNIRSSVFETNSSSTHSISINIGSYAGYTSITPDGNGKVTIEGRYFGWERELYNDSETKASYCYAWAKGKKRYMGMLEDVLLEHTGAKEIEFDSSSTSSYGEVGIDHQSYEVCETVFKGGKEIVKEFIFNPKSILTTDSDG